MIENPYTNDIKAYVIKWHGAVPEVGLEEQRRKFTGGPYSDHVIRVGKRAGELALKAMDRCTIRDTLICIAIGYLHDIVEDKRRTLEQVREFLATLVNQNRLQPEDCETILIGVRLLTKLDGETYSLLNYLRDIVPHIYSLIVKLADIEDNMSDLKDRSKLEKYQLTAYYLQNHLAKPIIKYEQTR